MKLTVEDVTRLFNVSEKTIYRWIKSSNLPAYRINSQYRFNYTELVEWAAAHRVNVVVPQTPSNAGHQDETLPSFSETLIAGGIYYRIGGHDKKTVLTEIVNLLKLPDRIDRNILSQILIAREEMGSTALGGGIAIPHVRDPIIFNVTQPLVALCFLETPIEFGAVDGELVHSLFTLISPTIKSHLHLLSQLSFFLRDPGFHAAVVQHAPREKILLEAQRVEALLRRDSIGIATPE
ncbi:helix-turn-helix domain-containing protein [candidate division KSB1 bacterium]|nr:MAG: helix-turn-helix domain-containing protein [candidate division KSB1 bacterium]